MASAIESLFEKARLGDGIARDAVYRLAFCRLRGIAAALLRRERAGHTLQPTALVSELFLKLRRMETRILSEDHFFRIAARAMHQVLIDHARVKSAARRIPPERVGELLAERGPECPASPEAILAARMVFDTLRAMDPQVAETVWLHCVEGLTVEEMSLSQHRKPWRVRADYEFGLQWMAQQLKG